MLMELADENWNPCLVKLCCQLMIIEHLLNCSLGIIEITCDSYYIGIGTFLSYHLLLLDRAYTMLRIKYDDPGSRYICKTCHCSLSCISGSCSKDHDLIPDIIFLRCCCHQMRKDGKCHILERDRCAVEQLQEICSVSLVKRSNLLCIKFAVVCLIDTVF